MKIIPNHLPSIHPSSHSISCLIHNSFTLRVSRLNAFDHMTSTTLWISLQFIYGHAWLNWQPWKIICDTYNLLPDANTSSGYPTIQNMLFGRTSGQSPGVHLGMHLVGSPERLSSHENASGRYAWLTTAMEPRIHEVVLTFLSKSCTQKTIKQTSTPHPGVDRYIP